MKALEDERDHFKREYERVKLSSNVAEKESHAATTSAPNNRSGSVSPTRHRSPQRSNQVSRTNHSLNYYDSCTDVLLFN